MVADVGRFFEEVCEPKGALILQQKDTPKWPAPELTKHAICEVLRKMWLANGGVRAEGANSPTVGMASGLKCHAGRPGIPITNLPVTPWGLARRDAFEPTRNTWP